MTQRVDRQAANDRLVFPICERLQVERGFVGVMAARLPSVLPACKDRIMAAMDHTDGEFAWGDIVERLLARDWQLWMTPKSCAVTAVRPQGQFSICAVICAGGDLDDMKACLPGIMEWAANIGCRRLYIEGRKGWGQVFGAELSHYVYRIDLGG